MCVRRGDGFLRFGYTLVWLLAVASNKKLVQICSEDCIHCLISPEEATFQALLAEA